MDSISQSQYVALIAFAVTLFGLYRVLIHAKDAKYEVLELECKRLQSKIEELEKRAPDLLLERVEKRNEAATKELERTGVEKQQLLDQFAALEKTMSEAPSKEQHQRLQEQVTELGRQIRALTEERQSLRQIALSSNDWLARFVVLEEGRITPMRRQILAQASAEIGLDRVQELSPAALRQAFAEVHARQQVARAGVTPLTKAAMLGLFGVGLVDAEHSLTPLGILALRLTAAYAPRPAEPAKSA